MRQERTEHSTCLCSSSLNENGHALVISCPQWTKNPTHGETVRLDSGLSRVVTEEAKLVELRYI